MKRNFILTILMLCIGFTTSFAVVGPATPTATTEVAAETPTATPLDFFKSVQTNLEAKKSTKGLTKKEQRLLKKVNRKVKRMERRKAGGKSWTVALILSILLGGLAIDRFYLGYIGLGILKLITLSGFGLWYLIDLILIAIRKVEPKNGSYTD